MGDGSMNLPPGFQFCPTDEELILNFLYPKASFLPCHPDIIPDLHLFLHDPWKLDGVALSSRNQWYFFSRAMENQVTESGFWKHADVEEPIFTTAGKKVGFKKYLCFYIGEAPDGIETNWVKEEYHLCNRWFKSACKKGANRKLDCSKLVLCRVYEKKISSPESLFDNDDDGTELSCLDEMFLSLDDDIDDISLPDWFD